MSHESHTLPTDYNSYLMANTFSILYLLLRRVNKSSAIQAYKSPLLRRIIPFISYTLVTRKLNDNTRVLIKVL